MNDRFAEIRAHGAAPAELEALFDQLPAVAVPDLIGLWQGAGVRTGHAWDGLLESAEWYGKEFVSAEVVHPLLFREGPDRFVRIDPRLLPLGLLLWFRRLPPVPPWAAAFGRQLLVTERPAARLRAVEFRGVVTAAMVYDHHPIIDVFRRVNDRTVLGWMDFRGFDTPFFFVLDRVRP